MPSRCRCLFAAVAALAAVAACADHAWACSIPVFRYALERWPAEPYDVLVFHKGPLAAEQQAVVDSLRKTAASERVMTNIEVRTIDLAAKQDEAVHAFWKAQEGAELPWVVVRYPFSLRFDGKAWSGRLAADAMKPLLDSPARRAIAKHLTAGVSAVWLFVEAGDAKKDEAAHKLLRNELKKLEQTLELPRPMDFWDYEEPAAADGQAPPKADEVLRASFAIVRLSRSDPAEQGFLDTLFGLEPELRKEATPMAFAIFGQGRALPPLIGDGINTDNIADVCIFVVGPCSCQVKAMNPGWDLLLAADWFGIEEMQPAREPQAPTLVGSVAAAPAEKGQGAASKKATEPSSANAPAAPHTAVAAAPPKAGGGALLRNVLLAAAAGIAILAGLSFLVMRRRGGVGGRA